MYTPCSKLPFSMKQTKCQLGLSDNLSTMAAGNTSQTIPAQITHVFVLCYPSTQIMHCYFDSSKSLITLCVLINNECKQLNCCVLGTFPGDFLASRGP